MDGQRPGFGCQWREKFPRLEDAGYNNHHRQSKDIIKARIFLPFSTLAAGLA
jgi:hypothetical protein